MTTLTFFLFKLNLEIFINYLYFCTNVVIPRLKTKKFNLLLSTVKLSYVYFVFVG